MEIRTNNQPRPIIHGYELSEKERKAFDYLEGEDLDMARFFRYKGELYDLGEFSRIVPRINQKGFDHAVDENDPLLKWHGIMTESYFSAVVVKYDDEFESVIVGFAHW